MNIKAIVTSASAAALLITSCSVKGDRAPCPCWLDIYLENAAEFSESVVLTGWGQDDVCLYRADIFTSDGTDCYETKVGKGYITSCAVLGATQSRISGNRIIIPYGQECDRYYASCNNTVDCTGEFGEDHLSIHKHHSILYVQPVYSHTSDENISFIITGSVNGMSLDTLEPSMGEFGCTLAPDESGNWCACLPRQLDDSLSLEVYVNGDKHLDIPIGRMIAGTGYSWQKKDLDDIFITVDINSKPCVSISLAGWSEEHYTFTI